MSPDMIEDIISLVNAKGRGILNDVANDDDGPPRPFAIFSREFMNDTDFPAVYVGMMTTVLAQMKTLSEDFDFYEKTLMSAFNLPVEIASVIAKKIETYDMLGGSEAAKAKASWLAQVRRHIEEGIRRTVNFFPALLGINWENDETQNYDIDYLYELKLLGQAVDDLQSRARLMKGQASIAAGMGLFQSAGGNDPYGDVYGDPVDVEEVKILDTMKPLMGTPLPLMLFGGLKKLVQLGTNASQTKLNDSLTQAGLSKAPGAENNVQNVSTKLAYDRLMSAAPDSVAHIDGPSVPLSALKTFLESINTTKETGGSGDTYSDVKSQFGDVVADAWRRGDAPAMMNGIVELAGDTMYSTGDRDLDEAIIGDVLSDMQAMHTGDVHELDKELGGLFTRARINHQVRKGKRRQRREAKRDAKEARKDARAAKLASARRFADEQYMAQSSSSPYADNSDVQEDTDYDNSVYDNPDDMYNTSLLDPGM